ncbi:HAD family hydrolase [Brachybacterium paraconglomeratum]|uniref:HAD family hydrolase n=1 Tax=Brachybacterium paraconglomeratum TaxID=173362 RepID=UPI00223BFF9C|nr:HAD family hydrolase [Brachybacterium paraconglomeratum]MCT1437983.1 HAD family hydrolase [Brachybacterium paraconglomeratum]
MTSSAPFRRRAAFLDFDGTLAENGIVPRAQAEAVLAARAAGHAVLLSTGRPASIVAPDVAALFDGMITSAGGHIRIGEELLRDVRFPAALARRTVEVLEAHGGAYALEAPEALWCSASSADRLERRRGTPVPEEGELGRGFADILEAISVPEDPATVSFAKISVWSSPVPIEQLAAEVGPEVGALPNSISEDGRGSGELHLVEVDKADGLRLAAEHLGLDIEDTVAVGDGPNDLGMLRAAGTGVAIRGSRAEVLAAADMEVGPPAERGMEEAFSRLGMF